MNTRLGPENTAPFLESAHRIMREFLQLWRCMPLLKNPPRLEISHRLSTSAARVSPNGTVIRLNIRLLRSDVTILREIICHETAHCVVSSRPGPREAPHGKTWRHLLEIAGYAPKTVYYLPENPVMKRKGIKRVIYIHTCPVCHYSLTAKKPMKNWRCARCMEAGLDGVLTIHSKCPSTTDEEAHHHAP